MILKFLLSLAGFVIMVAILGMAVVLIGETATGENGGKSNANGSETSSLYAGN